VLSFLALADIYHDEADVSLEVTPFRKAMEMTRPWKSQIDFHRRLEISHRARDSHIPTATPRDVVNRKLGWGISMTTPGEF
jgi:hypothetical protein